MQHSLLSHFVSSTAISLSAQSFRGPWGQASFEYPLQSNGATGPL